MTKAEMAERIADIPEDAQILAYHITVEEEDGQNTKGCIEADGEQALMHAGATLRHVAKCLEMDMETAAAIVVEWIKNKEEVAKLDADALSGGEDDADQ